LIGANECAEMTVSSEAKVNILLVDDRQENLLVLEVILGELGQNFVRASSGKEALDHILRDDFAVVLLDVQMQGLDGFETARRIRAQERSRHLPIIFLTAFESNEFSPAKAYTLGAVDYLVKPLVPEILRAKVDVFVNLFRRTEEVRELERREFERRLAEERLRERAERLDEANRQKDQFLAMLAHELRNPLGPIRNAVQIMNLLGPAHRDLHQAREVVERQVEHLARLVDELLDVSRITRGKMQLHPQRLDLGQVTRTAAEDYRPVLTQAGLSLRLDVPLTPAWVMGDATRLTQILNNLLDNAIKFSEGKGDVTVKVTADGVGRQAVLSVHDDGVGIEPEVLPRLFDIFSQADRSLDRSHGGLGLGLALVKGLAELHGGTVEAFSAGPGRGAEITVRLPLQDEPAALSQTPSSPPLAEKPSRVLVIEDHQDAANCLRLLLELLGHQVQVAYTGPDGVQAAKEWQPDIVVCDIGLPGLDGYGVARELRRNPDTAQVRLLALTGYGTEEDRRRSYQAGFDLHLVKPVDPHELLKVLVP
jgi:signal transduction histidine kinase